jgi:hypothetical protein
MAIVSNSRTGISKVISANAFRNNGGAMAFAGNIASNSPITKHVSYTNLAVHGFYGSKVTNPMTADQIADLLSGDGATVTTTRSSTFKVLNSGVFASMTKGKYVIIRQSDTLAGLPNTLMNSGAADFGNRRRVNKVVVIRTSHLYTFSLQNSAGRHSSRLVLTYSNKNYFTANAIGIGNGVGPDDAASPTIGVPGEFVIKEPALIPTLKDYPARTLA